MKIGQVLQVVLAAPVKWPGKAGNILKYIALALGIMDTVLEQEKPPPEKSSDDATEQIPRDESPGFTGSPVDDAEVEILPRERSEADEME